MRTVSNKLIYTLILSLVLFCFSMPAIAAGFTKDLSIGSGDVKSASDILKGETTKIYVTVHNNSDSDLSGVVKYYDEFTGSYIGVDQPVSVLSQKTDDVFMDFKSDSVGQHQISVRVAPWDESGDDPGNNKVSKSIYVDVDSDHDGIGDRLDNDDDNDGVNDNADSFPLDSKESKDTDKDGSGDNTDADDDNDSVADATDVFPTDPKESKDSDNDKTGDNSDPFPYDSTEWMDSDTDGLGDNTDPNDSNKGPVPTINVAKTDIKTGELVTFNALKSKDPDGQITKYEWNFGDGTSDNGVIIDHVFKKSGDYLVTLKTTDDKDETREMQLQVKVTSGWLLLALISTSLLLLLMLLGLLIPGSRFYYKKMSAGVKKGKKRLK